jgi:hypothetical protein
MPLLYFEFLLSTWFKLDAKSISLRGVHVRLYTLDWKNSTCVQFLENVSLPLSVEGVTFTIEEMRHVWCFTTWFYHWEKLILILSVDVATFFPLRLLLLLRTTLLSFVIRNLWILPLRTLDSTIWVLRSFYLHLKLSIETVTIEEICRLWVIVDGFYH